MYFFSTPDKSCKDFFKYKICSKILTSDISLESLSPFFEKDTPIEYRDKNINLLSKEDYVLIYKGRGSIGDSPREISFYKNAHRYKLDVQDIATFLIDTSSNCPFMSLTNSKLPLSNELIIETVLGPVLIFSLALQNIFCLHASAVEHNNKAILFLGKSGVGKSTLAEYLAINSNYKIKRIADDIVPVKIENSIAYTLPHFPQLKLSNDIQYSDDSPSKLSTSAIYILEKYNRRKSVEIKTLKSAENMLTLISNTVASRLYDKELNQKHLDFCSHVVGNVAFNEITYPHNKQTLTLVENLIIENS